MPDDPVGSKIPVYVVDDEPGVRLAVVDALDATGVPAWSFSSGEDLLQALDTIEPGCLVLDICMPGMGGLELMERLDARGCDWPVIAMTAHGDVPMAVAVMKLGAMEFVEKPFLQTLVDDAVARATIVMKVRRFERRQREEAAAAISRLTPRENAILRELMAGHQNKGVAYQLGLSVRTVEMHRANLLAKLQVRTVQESALLFSRARGQRSDNHRVTPDVSLGLGSLAQQGSTNP